VDYEHYLLAFFCLTPLRIIQRVNLDRRRIQLSSLMK